jgi:hypothetical protein
MPRNIQEPRTSRWRKWSSRTFIAVNLAGIILAIPLLAVLVPLLRIWWTTRSEESFARSQVMARSPAKTGDTFLALSVNPNSAAPSLSGAELQTLTNQLKLVSTLSDAELQKIVASQFGGKKRGADPQKFDRDSAVFHTITRKIRTVNEKKYYCYEVDLVDENKNHKSHVDVFEKADMDYERSMATLELVNSNPQLKKIYQAVSHVLAEESSTPSPKENPADENATIRMDRLPPKAQP